MIARFFFFIDNYFLLVGLIYWYLKTNESIFRKQLRPNMSSLSMNLQVFVVSKLSSTANTSSEK